MALGKNTRDHEEIRKWAEARGAVPAEVGGTERGDEPGILRFEFPNAPTHNDSKLKEISWDAFFEKFDENDLELVYQEKTADGAESNFDKLVHPSSEEHSKHPSRKSGGSSRSSGNHDSHSASKTNGSDRGSQSDSGKDLHSTKHRTR